MSDRGLTSWISPHPVDGQAWELFHENSKVGVYDAMPSDRAVAHRMAELIESFEFERCPAVELPPPAKLDAPLAEITSRRVSSRVLEPIELSLPALTATLEAAYGVTRDNDDGNYARPFRAVPSAGALYPLELFFSTCAVPGLPGGIYHYNPLRREIRRVRDADAIPALEAAFIQPELIRNASAVFYLTAVFERVVFKYGDRGYRFALLEAGHVGQALALAAGALGLGCTNLGGFFDRDLDAALGVDGLAWSSLYAAAIGGVARSEAHANNRAE